MYTPEIFPQESLNQILPSGFHGFWQLWRWFSIQQHPSPASQSISIYQVLPVVTLKRWFYSWPFQGWKRDLQLGDQFGSLARNWPLKKAWLEDNPHFPFWGVGWPIFRGQLLNFRGVFFLLRLPFRYCWLSFWMLGLSIAIAWKTRQVSGYCSFILNSLASWQYSKK